MFLIKYGNDSNVSYLMFCCFYSFELSLLYLFLTDKTRIIGLEAAVGTGLIQ